MKHERPCSLRPSRPQPCRKRRKAPRLNPAGRSVGLDPFRLSSGLKISRAMGWNDPLYRQIAETLPRGEEMADYVVSLSIEAQK